MAAPLKTLLILLESSFVLSFADTYLVFREPHCDSTADPNCGLASIEILGPDGNNQEINLKSLSNNNCERCATLLKPRHHEAMGSRLPSLDFSDYLVQLSSIQLLIYPVIVRTSKLSELIIECDSKPNLEVCGLCDETSNVTVENKFYNEKQIKKCANLIASSNLIPDPTGNTKADQKIAQGIVLVNTGQYEEAVQHFSSILQDYPMAISAYVGRGSAKVRKALSKLDKDMLESSLKDFSRAIEEKPSIAHIHVRQAEVLALLTRHNEAVESLTEAISLHETPRYYYKRGREHMILENFENAEADFKKSLRLNENQPDVLYFLGVALHGRGKLRMAVEVFKEALLLMPNDTDYMISLGNAYRDLGSFKQALDIFSQVLVRRRNHTLAHQLTGSLLFQRGRVSEAAQYFRNCLELDGKNDYCVYMQGVCHLSMGELFEGMKAHTKVIVNKEMTSVRLSPEYIRSHYLREYARYIHRNLDSNLTDNVIEKDLKPDFIDRWVKLLPYRLQHHYEEQPGLLPSISDVETPEFSSLSAEVRRLVCRAQEIGHLMRPGVDGFIENERLNIAMGLAAIDIGQRIERAVNKSTSFPRVNGKRMTWRHVFDIAVSYRRLVNPEHNVVWLDRLSTESLEKGFQHEHIFIRGHYENIRIMPYFELVFKLMKTMIQTFKGENVKDYEKFEKDVESANVCQDLLRIAREHRLNQHGFLITTQVPSTVNTKEKKHDGVILTLTDTGNIALSSNSAKVQFSVSTTTTRARLDSYQAELDVLFSRLLEEIKVTAAVERRQMDVDTIGGLILSLVYYFYNLSPLSRGTSAVAYTVAVGLLMSLGFEVTGKLPPGKLLQFEAMLSGAPDAFILVTRQWMKIKKSNASVSTLPSVAQHLPTVRRVMEVLSAGPGATC